ncbi:dihydroxyacetone kinase phosphoryl donor subunit DhaM [Kutzneria viridogrisea]|uniref:Phosphocarrier protein HPr n=2 Tax=Kutzneria TaxID=43356 RepID=W5WK23_9PSEU|nr:dihydroxyacetone kinase phosphoryl donor subunit DhaM [Kutzneria albida]AHI00927.1 hypothetical protein KALB_7569 [Kutzneria albida DSM 43870]MBA8926204.1 PTS hybrid protein [Kutzneria viridogrisea]
MTVGLVIVSHSAKLAEGVAELAQQMAPEVLIAPAGGTADGELGTDYDRVCAALDRVDRGGGVVLLYDLGSAQMIAELAVEGHSGAGEAFVVEAPLVEGAVAAAVAAQSGADIDGVSRAASSAAEAPVDFVVDDKPTAYRAEMVLHNEVGLHARPAALLARAMGGLRAEVAVRHGEQQADARSVLALMGLAARDGDTIEVVASGPDAREAIARVQALVERGFEE